MIAYYHVYNILGEAIIKFVYLNSNKEIIRPGVSGNIIFVSC